MAKIKAKTKLKTRKSIRKRRIDLSKMLRIVRFSYKF